MSHAPFKNCKPLHGLALWECFMVFNAPSESVEQDQCHFRLRDGLLSFNDSSISFFIFYYAAGDLVRKI